MRQDWWQKEVNPRWSVHTENQGANAAGDFQILKPHILQDLSLNSRTAQNLIARWLQLKRKKCFIWHAMNSEIISYFPTARFGLQGDQTSQS